MITDVDILTLEELIEQHDIVIIDFWASWCQPCITFSKVFEKIASLEPDLCFAKMQIDQASPELLESLGIFSVPHLMIFKHGTAVYSEAGTMPQDILMDLIQQTKKLNVTP